MVTGLSGVQFRLKSGQLTANQILEFCYSCDYERNDTPPFFTVQSRIEVIIREVIIPEITSIE